MVLAVQGVGALAVAQGQRPGAMAADVRERAQHSVLAADDEDRHLADHFDDVVARLDQLFAVRDQLPAAREHGLVLAFEHGLAEVVARW